MSIISNVHTYLVISFLLTGWLIFKFAYQKLDARLSKDVNDIRDLLNGLDKKKSESEQQIKLLKNDLIEANDHINKTVSDAEQKAKKLTEKSHQEISNIIKLKQGEYDQAIKKMKSSMTVEMQNKLVDAVIKELVRKLQTARDDRDFQNTSIENSLEMLNNLVDEYLKK